MTEHACVCCPQLRVNAEPRIYERGQVCQGCRSRLRSLLAEILDCYAQLETSPGSGGGQKVSGTPEHRLPLNVDVLDLSMPPPLRHVHDELGDQVGHPGVAAVLDSWARDWQTHRWSHLPPPTVASLTGWLLERLEWACDEHPAIAEFADELRALTAVVRSAAGMTRPPVERKVGVPCRGCEYMTLFRWSGSDYIECSSCSVLMTPDEYTRWVQLISAPEWRPWVKSIAERGAA